MLFRVKVQGDLEQGATDTSKLGSNAQRRLFNRLQGALGRIKKAAGSRPSKDKGNGRAQEDATPTSDTATTEDTTQPTSPRKALHQLKNRLKQRTTSRKSKERDSSEPPHPSKEDAAERASLRRENVRKRGERPQQRITGRHERHSVHRPSGASSSAPANPAAPIRHYKVAYGQMNDRVVAAPIHDPKEWWGAVLFGWICYCTCIPYHPAPPRRQDEDDSSDSD
ncbi:hypothetical protein HYDPIDRAFT_118358 [Hydnomerulius pinastri MD-312]|uniref:Uncharacterized protein n=1 Tax=Hydnomerulius pinastri MD-312 TaxID=994086 RepID=A0A0C9VPI6_9AGAM|nr:hypothetical protein HYDPIDRAFT_118358 [Hydnomerulius pinastri MD-312]